MGIQHAFQTTKLNDPTNDVSATQWNQDHVITDSITMVKTSATGIKIDTTAPAFGWRDILGHIVVSSLDPLRPSLNSYIGNFDDWQFISTGSQPKEVFIALHIPHDYVLGTDIFLHVHWSQKVVDSGGPGGTPGSVLWNFDVTYSKGHNQAAFFAPITTSVTQTASTTAFQHMLAEVQISAASPSAAQFASSLLEPDGIVLVRCYRNATLDTLNQDPFLHFCDVHYQSTNIATKQKAPNFYV